MHAISYVEKDKEKMTAAMVNCENANGVNNIAEMIIEAIPHCQ